MAKQFCVAHVSKYTASNFSSGGLGRHIDRELVPDNARAEAQDHNFEIVPGQNSMKDDIANRLATGYTGKKAIRKDAVLSCGVIFSGSHEQMKSIEKTGYLGDWAKDTYNFACDRWGKENIIRATVHLDEKTPHMHLHFVPLLEDGRLSAKEVTSRENLKALQNDYAEIMQNYGLERGIEGSKKKHITTKQHYQALHENKQDATAILQHPEAQELLQKLLQENQAFKREKELKEAEIQGKKKIETKINPDKPNSYEKHRGQTERRQNEQNRGNSETKKRNFGPSL